MPDVSLHFFFCNDPPPTQIYTLSLHDALPISDADIRRARPCGGYLDARARRVAEAPGKDLRAPGRCPLHALPRLGSAQAFRGRVPAGGGSSAPRLVAAGRPRPRGRSAAWGARELSGAAGRFVPAPRDLPARPALRAAQRRARARGRTTAHRALGGARPALRRHVPAYVRE